MQFRIKKVTYLDGSVKYFPQRRHWMYTCMLWNDFIITVAYDTEGPQSFWLEEDCREFLKKHLTGYEKDTVKSVSYKPYP